MKLAHDKKLHIAVGFGISLVFGLLVVPWFGLLLSVLAAVGKEMYDKHATGHTSEYDDAFATVIGGFAGLVAVLVLG